MVAACNAVVIGLAAVVLGVPLAGSIAVIKFLAAYIPFVGARRLSTPDDELGGDVDRLEVVDEHGHAQGVIPVVQDAVQERGVLAPGSP